AIAVLFPARPHQEIHDVQTEAGIPGPGLLVQKTTRRNAADIASLVDPCLQAIGANLDVADALRDGEEALLFLFDIRGDRAGPIAQQEDRQQIHDAADSVHGNSHPETVDSAAIFPHYNNITSSTPELTANPGRTPPVAPATQASPRARSKAKRFPTWHGL